LIWLDRSGMGRGNKTAVSGVQIVPQQYQARL